MDDAVLVRRFERVGDLPRHRQRVSGGDRSTRDPLRQILALDELHDERPDALLIFEAVDLGDVWVVQRGERLRFAGGPRHAIRIAADGVWHDLQVRSAIEPRVWGPKLLPRAAFANLGDDLVDAEPGRWANRHLSRRLYERAARRQDYSD